VDSVVPSGADPTPGNAAEPSADDGYTPAEPQAEAALGSDGATFVPSGSELAEENLPEPGSFDVVDSEAEELESSASDDHYDSATGIDVDQLSQAEADVEAEASSPRPQKKSRPVKKTTEPSSADQSDAKASTGSAATTVAKKNRPTRTRADATKSDAPKKTTLADFVRQIIQELKKVSWPTGAQLGLYFVIVLVFVVFMIAFIGLLDLLFGWLMLKIFG
jgi:preprotein translocase subunit SecE